MRLTRQSKFLTRKRTNRLLENQSNSRRMERVCYRRKTIANQNQTQHLLYLRLKLNLRPLKRINSNLQWNLCPLKRLNINLGEFLGLMGHRKISFSIYHFNTLAVNLSNKQKGFSFNLILSNQLWKTFLNLALLRTIHLNALNAAS